MSEKQLREKRALVELARRFGQEPAPLLLQQIHDLELEQARRLEREAAIRERVALDVQEMFKTEVKHELVQTQPEPEPPAALQEQAQEPAATEPTKSEPIPSTADLVAKVIRESTLVNAEPVLAQPKDLEREIKYLRDWISRIAATGPGSGEVNFRWLDDVERSSINKDWFLTYAPSTKKFTFVDTRVSTEAFDRTSSIALSTTPVLLKPNSSTNVKNMSYDSSTGVFTFLRECEVTLAITLNALATASNQRVFQYAERNTGSGWTVIANSGKSFQLTNGALTQIVNSQTISREPGEQIRYYIYTDGGKVDLITQTLPAISSGTVYVPAIRIQYAGR